MSETQRHQYSVTASVPEAQCAPPSGTAMPQLGSDKRSPANSSAPHDIFASTLPACRRAPVGFTLDDANCGAHASRMATDAVSMRTLAACMDNGANVPSTRQERQYSAPAVSARDYRVPGQPRYEGGPIAPASGAASAGASLDSGADSPGTYTSSDRQNPSTPSPATGTPVRQRRRSSRAAGVWLGVEPQVPQAAGGLQDLSPQELYRHFVSIRDTVLQKAGTCSRPEHQQYPDDGDCATDFQQSLWRSDTPAAEAEAADGSEDPECDGCDEPVGGSGAGASWAPTGIAAAGEPGQAEPHQHQRQHQPHQPRRSPRRDVQAPDSPVHRLSHTTYATERCYDPRSQTAAAVAAAAVAPLSAVECHSHYVPTAAASTTAESPLRAPSQGRATSLAGTGPPHQLGGGPPGLMIELPGSTGRHRQPKGCQQEGNRVVPEPHEGGQPGHEGVQPVIDLQQYYYSPTASSEALRRLSPFEGAVVNASDCVAYNALFGRGAPGFRSPRMPAGAQQEQPGGVDGEEVEEAASAVVGCPEDPAEPGQEQQNGHQCDAQSGGGGGGGGLGSCGSDGAPACRMCPSLLLGPRMEVCGTMPRTESLFSLQPSGEPQPSLGPTGSNESQSAQETELATCHAGGGGTGAGLVGATVAAAQMLVWQEDLAATMVDGPGSIPKLDERRVIASDRASDPVSDRTSDGPAVEELTLPTVTSRRGSTSLSSGVLPIPAGVSDAIRTSDPGDPEGDVVVHRSGPLTALPSPRGQGGSIAHQPSPDFLEAVRSLAAKMLLPLPGMGGGGGGGTGATAAATAVAASGSASGGVSHTLGHIPRHRGLASLDGFSMGGGSSYGGATATSAAVAASTSEPTAATTGGETPRAGSYRAYIPLPLPRMPSSGTAAAGGPQPGLPPMHSDPAVMATTVAVIKRCLDKGIPFAVMPAEHFAAVVSAAEQHDGPLAYHIMTTHCVHYPGTGRPAASIGGVTGLLPTAGSAVYGGGPGAAKAGSSGGAAGSAGAGGLLMGVALSGGSNSKRTSKAAAEAAAAVQELLAGGKPLHVMSPTEHQRLLIGVQYGVRHLHDLLVAQPAIATAAAAASATAAGLGGSMAANLSVDAAAAAAAGVAGGGAGRHGMVLLSLPPLAGAGPAAGRRHRRGSSIGSDCSFTATMTRMQSGGEAMGGGVGGAAEGAASGAIASRAAPSSSASPDPRAQHQQLLLQPAHRLRALLQAVQLGNMCRVAYLLELGADVNATDAGLASAPSGGAQLSSPRRHQTGSSGGGMRSALAGAFASSSGGGGSGGTSSGGSGVGAAVGGRTPLHYAAEAGSFGVSQYLLHHGAFVGVRDGTGRTAHEIARRKGHLAVAQLLKDAAERRRDVVRSNGRDGGSGSGVSTAFLMPGPAGGAPPKPPLGAKQVRSWSAPANDVGTITAAAAAVVLVAEGLQEQAVLEEAVLEEAVREEAEGAAAGTGVLVGGGVSGGERARGSNGEEPLDLPRLSSRGTSPGTTTLLIPETLRAQAQRDAAAVAAAAAGSHPSAAAAAGPDAGAAPATPPRQGSTGRTQDTPYATGSTAAAAVAAAAAAAGPGVGAGAGAGPTLGPTLGPRNRHQLSVVLESVDLQQQQQQVRRRSRKGGLLACFGCAL